MKYGLKQKDATSFSHYLSIVVTMMVVPYIQVKVKENLYDVLNPKITSLKTLLVGGNKTMLCHIISNLGLTSHKQTRLSI